MGSRLISWNVNGIRAVVKKDFFDSLEALKPDIMGIQETKAQDHEVEKALESLAGYHIYASHADRKGYAGTAILSRTEPVAVKYGIGMERHDNEGRVITAEYDDFYFVTAYIPNSGRGLVRHDYRGKWDNDFRLFLVDLDKHKPVVLCGDLNVAHQPIDLARPKSNYNKTAGYTQLEIDGMTRFLDAGFIDTFRELYPEKVEYTWWSYIGGARAKNVGWRIDYFLVSERLKDRVKDSFTCPDVMGSDHCPVGIILS